MRQLLLFCLGLAVESGFCMKWMEADLLLPGQPFNILGLKIFYTEENLASILGKGKNLPQRHKAHKEILKLIA